MILSSKKLKGLPKENLKEAERILKNLGRHLDEIGKKAETIKIAAIQKLLKRK